MHTRTFVTLNPAALAGALLFVGACGRDSVTTPRERATSPAHYGKTSAALSVTSASPPFGDQGATVDVHVYGTGFTSDAKATWLLHGVADSLHVRTNRTTFVSSTELVANVTIAGDATLAFWDVQVALAGGKNGVGSELFEVTSAQILGSGTPGGEAYIHNANDLGQAVGRTSGTTNLAFFYDESLGIVSLGNGEGWGIDPNGTLAVGRDGNNLATAWVRQPDNTWRPEPLPTFSNSVESNATSAARAVDGTLIVGGWDGAAPPRKSMPGIDRPVLWRRSGTSWSMPQALAIPVTSTNGSVYGVNGRGQAVGSLDASASGGIVWEDASTFTLLNGTPNYINAAGTIIVGIAAGNAGPVYWWRDPLTQVWHAPVLLPSLGGVGCPRGNARAINGAGIIVGDSCDGNNGQATAWQLDFSGSAPVLVGGPWRLPGLGVKNTQTVDAKTGLRVASAAYVTESVPYRATGGALSGSGQTRLAVRWQLNVDP